MKLPSIKSWLGSMFPSISYTTSSYPFPPGSQNGDGFERNRDTINWTPGAAHRVLMRSTVMACIRLISGTISTLPCNVFRRVDGDEREFARDHELYGLLHDSPNDDMTAKSFWKAVVASILLNGEAYGEKKYSEAGRLISIEYLDFGRMSWIVVAGDRQYRFTGADGQQRVIPRDMLFRVIGFTLNGLDGVSAIRYGAMMFNSAELADAAANSTFRKGLHPTIAFKYPKALKKDQRTEAREAIRKLSGAVNAGDPIILEAEMDAFPIGINPNDAQLLESRAWSVEEICRWFGVPPFMVGHSEKSTSWGSGLEQQNLGFLTYCLSDIIKAIEQACSKDLLTPVARRRYFVEFAIDALLRADSAGRAALYGSAAQNGWMSRAEIRKLENLPPVEGSDVLTCQSNLVPLDELGAQSDPATALQDSLKSFLGIVTDGNTRP